MIALDTHVWVWWTVDPERLSESQRQEIEEHEEDLIGVSAMSCWEVAKLYEYGRLELSVSLREWFRLALGYPGISIIPLTPEVAIESTSLPDGFHRDPSDQIIVATARVHECPLVTSDRKIVNYPHVQTI